MILHLSPSQGQRCGIAAFADELNPYLPDCTMISKTSDIDRSLDIIAEHEYGLHRNIDWQVISTCKRRKIVIQHAFSTQPKYKEINEFMFNTFDKIVFLTKRCKIEACNTYPQYMSKYHVLHHFAEKLRHEPKIEPLTNDYTIGIHGFAFPRNGFMRLLNMYQGKQNIHMLASISEFNQTAEMETSIYIDKIRRRIWEIEDQYGKGKVTLDFNYHETKEQIMDNLYEKCDALVHLTTSTPQYYNASGSINVLLATGLPVYAMDNMFTDAFPTDVLNRITNINDIFTSLMLNTTATVDGIKKYHEENSTKVFANNLIEVLNS